MLAVIRVALDGDGIGRAAPVEAEAALHVVPGILRALVPVGRLAVSALKPHRVDTVRGVVAETAAVAHAGAPIDKAVAQVDEQRPAYRPTSA